MNRRGFLQGMLSSVPALALSNNAVSSISKVEKEETNEIHEAIKETEKSLFIKPKISINGGVIEYADVFPVTTTGNKIIITIPYRGIYSIYTTNNFERNGLDALKGNDSMFLFKKFKDITLYLGESDIITTTFDKHTYFNMHYM